MGKKLKTPVVEKKSPGRPRLGRELIPMRSLRIDDETWDACSAKAQREGVTLSEWIRRTLRNAP